MGDQEVVSHHCQLTALLFRLWLHILVQDKQRIVHTKSGKPIQRYGQYKGKRQNCCKITSSIGRQGSQAGDAFFWFNVLGTNRGPTDRVQHTQKHQMVCQVDTIDFQSGNRSLRKSPHAFGSE